VVTHVYQRWHQVALVGSLLWARITGSSLSAGWVSQALFRARNASLYINIMSMSDVKVLSKFYSQISHICELRPRSIVRDQGCVRNPLCGRKMRRSVCAASD